MYQKEVVTSQHKNTCSRSKIKQGAITRTGCKICSKLRIEIPAWCRACVFIVNLDILCTVLVFLSLNLKINVIWYCLKCTFILFIHCSGFISNQFLHEVGALFRLCCATLNRKNKKGRKLIGSVVGHWKKYWNDHLFS